MIYFSRKIYGTVGEHKVSIKSNPKKPNEQFQVSLIKMHMHTKKYINPRKYVLIPDTINLH